MFNKTQQRERILAATILCVGAAYAQASLAKSKKQAATTEVPTSETPSLSVSEGISEKIYQQTTANISSQSSGTLAIDSSLRVFFPSQFELKNKYFNVPYSENAGNLVGFMVGPQLPLKKMSGSQLNSFAHLGYAYAQGVYAVESDSGLEVKDAVELQWIPLQTGLEAVTRPLTSQRITLGVISSVGIDWFTQSGELDGMSQTFWVPRYELGSSVTLFSPAQKGAGGFDGVRLSGLYYRSFSSDQINRGWAADLGARYAF